MNSKSGTLFVVATPIGNLADLSPRALEVLSTVAAVYAEDTRHTGRLLGHFGVSASLHSYHEHNERDLTPALVARLQAGEDLALVSDAGTPLISDPGYRLVRAAREAGLEVSPLPGPCALVAALSVSGMATDRFCFEGFLPAKGAARRQRLQDLQAEARTLVLYESSHRILDTLGDIAAVLGAERELCLARELTKAFETLYRGGAQSILETLQSHADHRKGEFVVVVSGNPGGDVEHDRAGKLARELAALLPKKKAAEIAAATFGVRKKTLYEDLLEDAG